jgi:Ca2+/H+ antiporter
MKKFLFGLVFLFTTYCFSDSTDVLDVNKFSKMKKVGTAFIASGTVITVTGAALEIIGYSRQIQAGPSNKKLFKKAGVGQAVLGGTLLGTGVPMLAGGILMSKAAKNKMKSSEPTLSFGVNFISFAVEF